VQRFARDMRDDSPDNHRMIEVLELQTAEAIAVPDLVVPI